VKLDQARNDALGAREARKWSAGILPADVTASRAVTLARETRCVTLAGSCAKGGWRTERLASAGIRVRRTRAAARDAAAPAGKMPALHLAPCCWIAMSEAGSVEVSNRAEWFGGRERVDDKSW
jgi:hypothetical protein